MDFLLSPWTIFGAGLTAAAAFAAAWFLLPGLIPAFLATKFGRQIAVIGGAVFAIWLAFVAVAKRGERKGVQKVEDKIRRDSIQKEERKEARDAELKNLDDAGVRRRSDRWLSDK